MLEKKNELSENNCSIFESYRVIKDCRDNNCFTRPFLNLLAWNVRCITNKKLNVIKQYLDEWSKNSILGGTSNIFPLTSSGCRKNYFIDIISFTETWLHNDKFDLFNLKNYISFAVNRKDDKKGGGILLYVHKNYRACVINSNVDDHVEYLLVKVLIGHDEWHVLSVYRPPSGDVEVFLSVIEKLAQTVDTNKLIITGDMNLNVLNINEMECKEYNEILLSLNLSVANKAITRRNPITGISTLIDHLIMSIFHENYIIITSKAISLISDHNFLILMFELDLPTTRNRIKKIQRVNNKLVKEAFYNDLLSINQDIVNLNNSAVNTYFNIIHDSLIKAIETGSKQLSAKLPKIHLTLPKWADDKYIEMLNCLYNLEEKIDKRSNNGMEFDILQKKFDDLNIIRDQYATTKSRIYYRKAEINNLNCAWILINDLIGRNDKGASNALIKDSDGNYLIDSSEIANSFQKKFLEVYSTNQEICSIEDHKYIGETVLNTFSFEEITTESIFLDIGALNRKKGPGFDKVTANILQTCAEGLSPHLANIFNVMIRTGQYPERLKMAVVKPIPKNGKSLDLNNCRPISLLPKIDKIFESILCNQLNTFFMASGIIDRFQYGFQPGKGCSDALCMILHHISTIIDTGKSVLLLSFDIHKAFDTVCHKVLLRKLNFMGIRGKSYDLIKSFLSDRKQVVKFGNSMSETGVFNVGVAQGSCCGPPLFNLLINDLASLRTYSTFFRYADDLVAVFPVDPKNLQSDVEHLTNDLKSITEYYQMNHLQINCTKSKFLIIGSDTPHLVNVLEHYSIEKTEELKYLGFLIDSDLKLIGQIDKICKSVAQGINALRFLRNNLSVESLLLFFHGHIQSQISYCSFALLRCRAIDIERLQRLQSKALRIIFNLPDLHPSSELFEKEAKEIMCVCGLIYYSALVMVKKSLFCTDSSLPVIRKLRSSRQYNLALSMANKKVKVNDITHIGCRLFNELPNDIKRESNLFLYKAQLKKFILSRNKSLIKHGQFTSKTFNL